MILIQRLKKIKRKKLLQEILFDIIFYFIVLIILSTAIQIRLDREESDIFIINNDIETDSNYTNGEIIDNSQLKYKYVASSRGKYFYEISSSRAKSLSEKNKLYFVTTEDAKKLGFKPYFND